MAEAFDGEWLPAVLGRQVTSFLSFADIEKGEGWFDRLLNELGKADAALLCLTPENVDSPWMHFESGMVSRMGRGKVFTYFLGTDASQIKDPLKQIQVTLSTESDTEKLGMKLAALAQVPENETKKALAAGWERLAKVIREVKVPGMEDVFRALRNSS